MMIVILPYESYMQQQYVDYDDGNENESEDDDVTNATPGAPPHMDHVVSVEQTQLLLTRT